MSSTNDRPQSRVQQAAEPAQENNQGVRVVLHRRARDRANKPVSCSDCGKIKHNREIEARSIDGTITICDACIEDLLSPDPEDELPYLKAMRGANGGIYRSANPRAPIIGFKRKTMYVLCGQTVTIIDRRSNREFVFYDGTSNGPLDLRTVARMFPL